MPTPNDQVALETILTALVKLSEGDQRRIVRAVAIFVGVDLAPCDDDDDSA